MDKRTERQIARINELSALARTSWIGLLAYLAFIFVTLLGVEDADFFVPSRQTQLPLVNVSIPTASFFIFAPILAAALYVYLHLFLIKLWDAIADAPTRVRLETSEMRWVPLADAIHPWLANDFACAIKGRGAQSDRPLRWLSGLVTWFLIWIATPAILAFFWWWSMTAHNEGLTLLIALCLFVAVSAGSASWFRAREKLRGRRPALWRRAGRRTIASLLAVLLMMISWSRAEGGFENWASWAVDRADTALRTETQPENRFDAPPETRLLRKCYPEDFAGRGAQGPPLAICFDSHQVELPSEMVREARIEQTWWVPGEKNRLTRWLQTRLSRWLDEDWTPLASTDLADEQLVPLPENWRNPETARKRFRADWCKREALKMEVCDHLEEADRTHPPHVAKARTDYCNQHDIEDGDACTQHFSGLDDRFKTDWIEERTSTLANLPALNLSGRDLRRANAPRASFVNADLSLARLEGADLSGARLEGAVLIEARLEGAVLWQADLRSAKWAATHTALAAHFADLRGAQDLTQAQLDQMIGNAETLLPLNPGRKDPLVVWTCWAEPPDFWDNIVEIWRREHSVGEEDLRSFFICGDPSDRRPTGTPLALNAPYPDDHPLHPDNRN